MKTSWKFFSDSLIKDIHSVPFLQNIELQGHSMQMMDDDDDTISHYVCVVVGK